jgi:phospholipid/cholesterol/gamma-HCH transport system substrate-binding protein
MPLQVETDSEIALLHRGTRRFLIAGFCVTLLLVGTMFVRQGLLRDTAHYNFITHSAQDITKGQAVKIAGFKVGAVDEVVLQPDGQVAVDIKINADATRFVTRDAVIELRKEGFIGSGFLEIKPGKDREHLAEEDSQLTFTRGEALGALVNDLHAKLTPILDNLKTITGTLADEQRGIPATLAQVQKVSTSLNGLLQTSQQEVGHVAQAATKTLNQANTNLVQLQQTLTSVNTRLPALLDRAQGITDHLERLTANAANTVPPILQDGQAAAADVREILTGAKTAWPIRNFVAAPGAGHPLKADSDPHAEASRAPR